MEGYLADLFVAQAREQQLRAPEWMIRLYLRLFPIPLGKTLRLDMANDLVSDQDLTGKRVLDVGCGIGDLSFMLARRGAEVVGVELDPHKVACANQIAQRWRFDGLRFVAGDVTDLSTMGLGQFDDVFCLAVLEHIKDDIGLLQQMRNALRPGGLLVLEVPSARRRTIEAKEEGDGHVRPGYVFEDLPPLLARTAFRVLDHRAMDPLGLMYYWNACSLPGTKAEHLLATLVAPIFITLIRATSRVIKRPAGELCFLAARD
jgi:SAM-dependent methyltransferase